MINEENSTLERTGKVSEGLLGGPPTNAWSLGITGAVTPALACAMDKLGASTTLSPPHRDAQCHVDDALVLLASADDTERAVSRWPRRDTSRRGRAGRREQPRRGRDAGCEGSGCR